MNLWLLLAVPPGRVRGGSAGLRSAGENLSASVNSCPGMSKEIRVRSFEVSQHAVVVRSVRTGNPFFVEAVGDSSRQLKVVCGESEALDLTHL